MKVDSSAPIGVFDSGVGGLTVMRELLEVLPHEKIIYIGDTAHLPYGDKSSPEVCQYVRQIIDYFLTRQIKMLVVACNSSVAAADSLLQEVARFLPVISVVDPMVEYVATRYGGQEVGLIGTQLTVSSGIYQQKLAKMPNAIILKSLATPRLVPLIEGLTDDRESLQLVLQNYLQDPLFKGIKALILGCTHYSLIKDIVQKFVPDNVAVLDAAQITAETVAHRLAILNLLNLQDDSPTPEFLLSKITPRFCKVVQEFLGIGGSTVKVCPHKFEL